MNVSVQHLGLWKRLKENECDLKAYVGRQFKGLMKAFDAYIDVGDNKKRIKN